MIRLVDELDGMPSCINTCDMCGQTPVGSWAKGFGCDHCKGPHAALRATMMEHGFSDEEIARAVSMVGARHV